MRNRRCMWPSKKGIAHSLVVISSTSKCRQVNRICILECWVCPLIRSTFPFLSMNPKLWEKRASVPSFVNYSPIVRIPILKWKVFPCNRYHCFYDVVNMLWNNGIPSTTVRSNESKPCYLVWFWLQERLTFEKKSLIPCFANSHESAS